MKILFCTYTFSDYGLDSLYNGLCQKLGNENVLEYPNKPTLHGVKENRYAWYPNFFNYPVTKTDDEKIEMLKNNEFDIILVGCRSITDFRDIRGNSKVKIHNRFFELLKSNTIFLIDQADTDVVNENLIEELKPRLYFKREYNPIKKYPKEVLPFSFSYSRVIEIEKLERINELIWAGKVTKHRKPFIQYCETLRGKQFFNGWKSQKYAKKLMTYRIGLNLKGLGNDTVRYYEIPAYGALLFSEKLDIHIDNDFEDGKTAIFFKDLNEMKVKLKYCLDNPEYVDKIRLAGQEHYNKYHTSKKRAEQLLDKI